MLFRAVIGILVAPLLAACAPGSTTLNEQNPAGGAVEPGPTSPIVDPAEQEYMAKIVCTDIGESGERFYEELYDPSYLQKKPVKMSPLGGWMAVGGLMDIADGYNDELDGSKNIAKTSPQVRDAVTAMVNDAERVSRRFSDAAKAELGFDETLLPPLFSSFTSALSACDSAGFKVDWSK